MYSPHSYEQNRKLYISRLVSLANETSIASLCRRWKMEETRLGGTFTTNSSIDPRIVRPQTSRVSLRNVHVISQSRDDLSTSLPWYRDSILVHVGSTEWDIPVTSETNQLHDDVQRPNCRNCSHTQTKLTRSKRRSCVCSILFLGCFLCLVLVLIKLYGCLSS